MTNFSVSQVNFTIATSKIAQGNINYYKSPNLQTSPRLRLLPGDPYKQAATRLP